MAREIPHTSRANLYSILPEEITLVWPKRCKEMGPKDLTVEEHPELYHYLASDITDPLKESDIQSVLAPVPNSRTGARIGIIQPISVCAIELKDGEWISSKSAKAGTEVRYVACAGRTRTRWCREANRRIRSEGGKKDSFLWVRFEVKPYDGQTAGLVRDLENRVRKTLKPLDLAQMAVERKSQGVPKQLIMQSLGVTSWQQVLNYEALLGLSASLQELVNAGAIPMTEALRVGKDLGAQEQEQAAAKIQAVLESKKAEADAKAPAVTLFDESEDAPPAEPKKQPKLSAKETRAAIGDASAAARMSVSRIQDWIRHLETIHNDSSTHLVLATLRTVLGTGDMTKLPRFAPPTKAKHAAGAPA